MGNWTDRGSTSNAEESKYIVGADIVIYEDASTYCHEIGTTLASIHSIDDQENAKIACNAVHDGTGCWIGLTKTNDIWSWQDWSLTDFGFINNDPTNTSIDNNAWPWNEIHHSPEGDGNCTQLRSVNNWEYHWNDIPCDQLSSYPLCNAVPPS